MKRHSRIALVASATALGSGLALGGATDAGASIPSGATAHGHLAAATQKASHHAASQTRLWTQVPGGRNGYTDITHTYQSAGGGYYRGEMKGSLHHYYAPRNRQVVVMFRVDGSLGGYSPVTTGNTTFRKTYSHFKKVSARICLHRAGVPIHLNSGVSYCSPWWG
ncbi:hypothetical protein ACH4TE_24385 [Streptomyces sioyaensis]|uniref:hypothetical protein n=1 Tax=Streptomyces sioyaensis TaxID=67364 RepID=UPI0037AC76A2